MPVSLQVTSGPSAGMRIHISRGLIVKIGRTDWADYSFPDDNAMADIHFAIHADGPGCLINDLSGGAGTMVNGAPVKEATLHTGDSVKAGRTAFSVAVDGELAPVRQTTPAAAPEQVAAAPKAPSQAADFAQSLKLSDEARELLQDNMEPANFLDLLIKHELYPDGLRFLAFWLPKPVAVAWACDCVEQICGATFGPEEQQALSAARRWAADPSEANRRSAESAANDTNFTGAASWLALAVFWSGGSLAGPDLPPVPPGDALTAEAITGAFMMAATQHEPQHAFSRYHEILERGQTLVPKSS